VGEWVSGRGGEGGREKRRENARDQNRPGARASSPGSVRARPAPTCRFTTVLGGRGSARVGWGRGGVGVETVPVGATHLLVGPWRDDEPRPRPARGCRAPEGRAAVGPGPPPRPWSGTWAAAGDWAGRSARKPEPTRGVESYGPSEGNEANSRASGRLPGNIGMPSAATSGRGKSRRRVRQDPLCSSPHSGQPRASGPAVRVGPRPFADNPNPPAAPAPAQARAARQVFHRSAILRGGPRAP
jgi:hypothetical protein